jgi:hypothetical protein
MIYPILNTITASSFLAITKDKDIFFNYLTKIEALSVVFLAFILILAKAVDRFSVVFSTFAKSFFWRNIYYSSF